MVANLDYTIANVLSGLKPNNSRQEIELLTYYPELGKSPILRSFQIERQTGFSLGRKDDTATILSPIP